MTRFRTPFEELMAAASLVREAAANSAPGPWHTRGLPASAAAWIKVASPQLAEPLAQSLEHHAEDHTTHDCEWPHCGALELARVINSSRGRNT